MVGRSGNPLASEENGTIWVRQNSSISRARRLLLPPYLRDVSQSRSNSSISGYTSVLFSGSFDTNFASPSFNQARECSSTELLREDAALSNPQTYFSSSIPCNCDAWLASMDHVVHHDVDHAPATARLIHRSPFRPSWLTITYSSVKPLHYTVSSSSSSCWQSASQTHHPPLHPTVNLFRRSTPSFDSLLSTHTP